MRRNPSSVPRERAALGERGLLRSSSACRGAVAPVRRTGAGKLGRIERNSDLPLRQLTSNTRRNRSSVPRGRAAPGGRGLLRSSSACRGAVAPVRRTGAVKLGRIERNSDLPSRQLTSNTRRNRSSVPRERAAPGGRGLLRSSSACRGAVAPVRRTGAVKLGRKWRDSDPLSPRFCTNYWANRSTVPRERAAPGGRGLLRSSSAYRSAVAPVRRTGAVKLGRIERNSDLPSRQLTSNMRRNRSSVPKERAALGERGLLRSSSACRGAVAPVRRTGAVKLGRKWRDSDPLSPRFCTNYWANRSTVPRERAAPGGRGLLPSDVRMGRTSLESRASMTITITNYDYEHDKPKTLISCLLSPISYLLSPISYLFPAYRHSGAPA